MKERLVIFAGAILIAAAILAHGMIAGRASAEGAVRQRWEYAQFRNDGQMLNNGMCVYSGKPVTEMDNVGAQGWEYAFSYVYPEVVVNNNAKRGEALSTTLCAAYTVFKRPAL